MNFNGYPAWSQSDTSSSVASDRMPHFVMDYSLFRVAKYLRLLGYDTLCDHNIRQNQLIRIAARDCRTIVTCTPYLTQQAEQHNRRARRLRELALKEREAEAEIEAKAEAAAAAALTAVAAACEKSSPSSPKAGHRGELLGYDSDGASIYSDSEDDAPPADIRSAAAAAAVDAASTAPQESQLPTHSNTNGLSSMIPDGSDDYHDPNEQEIQVITIPKLTSAEFMSSVADVIRTAGLRFDLKRVFSRCVKCNVPLIEVPKADVAGRIHDTVYRVYEEFTECPQCKKVFWGIDGQRIINYKSLRTLNHLQAVCRLARHSNGNSAAEPECSDDSCNYIRHFRSYPKRVKKCIMSFMAEEDLVQLENAFPALHEIIFPFREAYRKQGKTETAATTVVVDKEDKKSGDKEA